MTISKSILGFKDLLFFVFLSILIHIILLKLPLFKTSKIPGIEAFNEPMVVEIDESLLRESKPLAPHSEKQIVETEKALNSKTPQDSKFLGKWNQTADEQMKAKLVDAFKEGKMGSMSNNVISNLGESEKSEKKVKDWQSLTLNDLGIGSGFSGSTDDYLENLREGERTILSTREFRYFSYYQRIKDRLRQYWKPMIQTEIQKLWQKGIMLKKDELVTRLQVLLNEKGEIEKVSRIMGCGIRELDSVAIDAFHKASPFPHPPSGIIESDGLVRINWDFILKLETAPVVRFQHAGMPPPP